MSKAVMISIKPKWVELIAAGGKTVEVRKTRPKIDVPFKCYIYCTLNGSNEFFHETLNGDVARWNREKWWDKKGKVVGEFVCDEISEYYYGPDFDPSSDHGLMMYYITTAEGEKTCLEYSELERYGAGKALYGWHISNLKMYDKPKELKEFYAPTETYCEKERCGGCPKDQIMGLDGNYAFDCEWKRPILRAPQSWLYVEELK